MNQKLSMEELGRISETEFKKKKKLPIIIVLDNLRSAYNVGSVFRTADAFAISAIYLIGITATPENKEVIKTSLGAEKSIEWWYFKTASECIELLKQTNTLIYCIEQTTNSLVLDCFTPKSEFRSAFIFGNEVKGVSEFIINHSDACIEIPQFGTKHSFNVSVTAAIVLWDYFIKTKRP